MYPFPAKLVRLGEEALEVFFLNIQNKYLKMSEMVQIKYGIHLYIDERDLAYDTEPMDSDTEFASEEEDNLQARNEETEEEEFTSQWQSFWKDQIEEANLQTFTYTFDGAVVRYRRSSHQMPSEFIRIIPESGLMQHFYKDKKTNAAKLQEFNLPEAYAAYSSVGGS